MSRPGDAEAVKLVMSVFSAQSRLLNEATAELSCRYGGIDFVSALIPFHYTDYYEQEMGSPLCRRFISFENLVRPESLPDIKRATNALEEKYATGHRRQINIDPGYISHAHLILATGKGYTHRPYLRDGIYADLTLIYQSGTFQSLPWTYPDYAAKDTLAMFNIIRARYALQAKTSRQAKI
ncbi:MAG: DUF4416 family protein [Deltaproteobacteria bacterium]|nr:DUF4416 family protein [Deltaproteobacteria bacterium]